MENIEAASRTEGLHVGHCARWEFILLKSN